MLIGVVGYPIVVGLLLRKYSNNLSDATFNNAYEEIRVDKEKLYYYFIRYYKQLFIAIIISLSYKASPVIPLVLLIIVNAIDAVLLLALKPLGMVQQ
jgi:hypothetical protein